MNSAYADLAKRMSASFIALKGAAGEDFFVNTDMIVHVVEKGGTCILSMYGGEMTSASNYFCERRELKMTLNEV